MAAKKPKKKSQQRQDGAGDMSAPLGMLQNLLGSMPDEAKLELLSAMMGGPAEALLTPARSKPRTKVQREINRLVNLARSQDTTNQALPLLLQAEQAARKALGKRFDMLIGRMDDDAAGHTYLDVKVELAQALTATGQPQAALAHLEEVYRLDPSDPLEARLLLLANYFDLDRLDDADRLLDNDCSEPWAAWLFGRLLLALRRGERGQEVDDQLQAAHQANPFVLSLLLGERMPDPTPPYRVEMGEDSEAQLCAGDFLPAWKNTPGAVSWLRQAAVRLRIDIEPPSDEDPRPRRLSARDYAKLPSHKHATWIVGLHEAGLAQFPGEGQPQNHWFTFAFSPDNDLIGFQVDDDAPTPRELWDNLVEFMLDERQAGRPARMLVFPPSLVPALKKKDAERAKIELESIDRAPELAVLLEQLSERMLGGAQAAASLDPEIIRSAPLEVDEVWEAAVVQLQRRLDVAGQSLRPSIALVMSRAGGVILWHELFTESPPDGALDSAVRMAIARPVVGPSRRPRQVIVRDHDEALSLAALSDEAGITCTTERDLPLIAEAVAHLTEEFLGGEPHVVLTKGEGTTPADLERYYTAAAAFFRAQPWKHFAMDELVGLAHQSRPGHRYYALVMGQSGITMGLAIYERLKDIETMFEGRSERTAFDSFSVMFGEEASIAPADLDAIEQFGWPIATPEAYPDTLRIYPGPTADSPRVETPTASELRFVTAALEAVTRLAQHRDQKTITLPLEDTFLTATRLGFVGALNQRL